MDESLVESFTTATSGFEVGQFPQNILFRYLCILHGSQASHQYCLISPHRRYGTFLYEDTLPVCCVPVPLPVYVPTCLFDCMSPVCLTAVFLHACPAASLPAFCLSAYKTTCLSACLTTCHFVCRCMSDCMLARVPDCMSAFLPDCISACLFHH